MPKPSEQLRPLNLKHNQRVQLSAIVLKFDHFIHAVVTNEVEGIRRDAIEDIEKSGRLADKYWRDWSAIHTAAENLVKAGRWSCPDLSEDEQARLWDALVAAVAPREVLVQP